MIYLWKMLLLGAESPKAVHSHARVLGTHWKAGTNKSERNWVQNVFSVHLWPIKSLSFVAYQTQGRQIEHKVETCAGLITVPHQKAQRTQPGPWLLTDPAELTKWFQPPLRMKPTAWTSFSHNPDNTMVFGVSSKIRKCNLFILTLPNSCLLFCFSNRGSFWSSGSDESCDPSSSTAWILRFKTHNTVPGS